MKKFAIITIVSLLLSGCGHAQWVAMKDSTSAASFINPLGFAAHMVGTVGEFATRPHTAARHTESDNKL